MASSVEENRTLAESDTDDRLAAEGLKQLGYQQELTRVSISSFNQSIASFLIHGSRLGGFFTFYSVRCFICFHFLKLMTNLFQ